MKKNNQKIAIVSAHEGSMSWKMTAKKITNNFQKSLNLSIITDIQYRTSSRLRRLFNRILIYFIFPIKVLLSKKKLARMDYIIVITSPFFLPLIITWLADKDKIIVLHNDLYPEGFYKIPYIKYFSNLFNPYKELNNKYLDGCRNHIYLSENHAKLRTYNNQKVIFPPAVKRVQNNSSSFQNNEPIKIGYCGTLGFNHAGLEFLDILKNSVFSSETEFHFHISGAIAKLFSQKASKIRNKNNYSIIVSMPLIDSEYLKFMQSLDFGLILLSAGSSDTVFPSKMAAHLSFGHPIILLSDGKNFLYEFINNHKIGYCINLDDQNFFDFDDSIYNTFALYKNNAKNIFDKYFNYESVSSQFLELMN